MYKQMLLYILNENTIWPSGAIARDIVSQEKNTMCTWLKFLNFVCKPFENSF